MFEARLILLKLQKANWTFSLLSLLWTVIVNHNNTREEILSKPIAFIPHDIDRIFVQFNQRKKYVVTFLGRITHLPIQMSIYFMTPRLDMYSKFCERYMLIRDNNAEE